MGLHKSMASGKKTRFSAVVNQQSKLVFGVQAQKNGDLTIIIPSQGRIFDDGSVIQNQKYSIHRSLRSDNGAFTIKQTIDFVQKPSLTTVQYRHRSSEQWLVPIFIQRVLQLSFEKYDLKTRANDTRKSVQFRRKFELVSLCAVCIGQGGRFNRCAASRLELCVSRVRTLHASHIFWLPLGERASQRRHFHIDD